MYLSECLGKGGIYAKVVADSTANGVRLTTLELNYHRFIHAEFMTHRLFSRNASSSRAIPVDKMINQVEYDPAIPIHWGKNKPGMQATEEVQDLSGKWEIYAKNTAAFAKSLKSHGLHKQVTNRILEPYQFIKVIVTATEWDNFFALRLHKDAQPEIYELARCMKEAMDQSTPTKLRPRDWHLPYVRSDIQEDKLWVGLDSDCPCFDWKKARKASVARCARVSYMNHDKTECDVDKDIALADMLLEAGHMSPFEHQATPMDLDKKFYQGGVTHRDWLDWYWSANFRGWVQHRQLLNK